MAIRPWVTPQNVKEYSDYTEVKMRDDKKLLIDIIRAENYVIKYTNNYFDGQDGRGNVLPVPSDVKTAVVLISEAYVHNAAIKTNQGGKKSETFDDYSYTMGEISEIDITGLGLESLLDNYIIKKPSDTVIMRIRGL